MLKTAGIILLMGVALGQTGKPANSDDALVVVLPCPGHPVSFDQVEKHVHKLPDGTKANFIVVRRIYRSASGKIRIETETKSSSGQVLNLYVSVSDPENGSHMIFSPKEKIAYRTTMHRGAVGCENQFAVTDAADGMESQRKWNVKKEDIGSRFMEGVKYEGSRIITSAEDDPSLTTTLEQWYAEKLKIGMINRSGPYKSYTVHIQNLRLEEPDRGLFTVPADYKVLDVQFPSQESKLR